MCYAQTVKKETTPVFNNQLFKRSSSKSLHQEGRTRTYTHYSGICKKYKNTNYLENSVEECRPQSVACLYHLRVNFLFGCCKENNLELTGAIKNGKVNRTQDISVNIKFNKSTCTVGSNGQQMR